MHGDWAFPGIDAPLGDLAWYLAVNCDRLPETKERTVERYRQSLEGRGIETEGWWGQQLAWNKCEQADELAWWDDRVAEALPLLT